MSTTTTTATTSDIDLASYGVNTTSFPPDKNATWTYPVERDGWTLAHNAIRGEMTELTAAMRAVQQRKREGGLAAWEVEALQKALAAHVEHVHGHHTTEDDKFVPQLNERFRYPKKLDTDHEVLVAKLKKVEEKAKALKAGGSLDSLLKEFVEYDALMRPHLAEEEAIGLPLFRAYFSRAEADKMVEEIVKGLPQFEMGSFIHYQTPENFRSIFMPQQGIPFFVWYLSFSSMHRVFVERFDGPVKALTSGEEPKPVRPWWWIFWW